MMLWSENQVVCAGALNGIPHACVLALLPPQEENTHMCAFPLSPLEPDSPLSVSACGNVSSSGHVHPMLAVGLKTDPRCVSDAAVQEHERRACVCDVVGGVDVRR